MCFAPFLWVVSKPPVCFSFDSIPSFVVGLVLLQQAREASFRSIKTIAECLADEIVNASKGSSSSYAIKKKDEVERVSKANR